MMKFPVLICAVLLAGASAWGRPGRDAPQYTADTSLLPTLTAEDRAAIRHAIPTRAAVTPDRPRQVLVFNLHVRNGEVMAGHSSIPASKYALEQMGLATRAYEVTFSSDPAIFAPERLGAFDAVIFNNTAGVLTENKDLRWALLDYVWSGGGFVGIHAAGATFCQWPDFDIFPEYGAMLGGFESGGHPWKPHEWINLKVDDPDHPVAAAFGGRNFDVSDEVFQFTHPYSRNRQRVLLSIDKTRTDWSQERRILPERWEDGDIAISWVKRYGRGRVFYTSLGHNPHIHYNPTVLRHFLDGVQFATGDIDAPATPSAKLNPAELAREQLDWRFGVAAYTFKNHTLFETIEKVDELGLAWVGGLNVQTVSDDIPKKLTPDLSEAEIRQVREKLVAHGVTMLTYYIFDIPGNEEDCRRIFEFGKKLGIETFISEPKIEDLDLIERFCEEYDIKLALHNHGQRLSPVYMHPEKIVEITRGRSPLIGAACDFGHWAKEGIDPYLAIRTLGDRVITLQMHDQSALAADGHDVPWGTGVVDLEGIAHFLQRENIRPVMFGLEYSYNWDHSLPEIRASIDYFNRLSLEVADQATATRVARHDY